MNKKKGTPLREQIIRRVQQAILDSGMTYKQIAEKSGMSTFVISTYMMKDPKLPSVETLARLLPVLGVSAERSERQLLYKAGRMQRLRERAMPARKREGLRGKDSSPGPAEPLRRLRVLLRGHACPEGGQSEKL